ncbi:MAG TPA: hypothetical protein VMD92_02730 [Acidobacteriaceae bacterium]|nr:hypothetical protein [Acidobacteriaceae bacterium]
MDKNYRQKAVRDETVSDKAASREIVSGEEAPQNTRAAEAALSMGEG